jgi:P4 family phage/plasmid primase-like protien
MSKNRDYDPAAVFLSALFGGEMTEGAVEIRCCPNDGVELPAKSLFTRDLEDILLHLVRHDIPGMGTYYAVATRKMGKASGKRDNLCELRTLWSDVDFKRLAPRFRSVEAIVEMGQSLPYPPSIYIATGGGVHLLWLLDETLDVSLERPGAAALEATIVDTLKRLAGVVGGDPRVCDLARILRLPGTVNSKPGVIDGECRVIEEVSDWERQYPLADLEEWLDWQRPMVELVEEVPVAPSSRPSAAPPDPFAAYAADLGIHLPKDIDALLEGMRYGGGDAGIHAVQLAVSASLAKRGEPVDDIVAMLLEVTRRAAGMDGDRWNWSREEANIKRMTEDAILKYGVIKRDKPDYRQEQPAPPPKQASAGGPTPATVIDMKTKREEREEREKARKKDKEAKVSEEASTTEKIAALAFKAWTEERGPVIVTEEGMWTYSGGIWERPGAAMDLALKVKIQGATLAMGKDPSPNRKNAVFRFLMESTSLYRSDVPWDQHELVVCRNTALDPVTGERVPAGPDLYATSRIETDYEPEATCPRWIGFLNDVFGWHREPEVRDAIIGVIQEWFGLLLWRGTKTRDMKMALILYGPSRTGKTAISTVARGLVAGRCAGVMAKLLEQHFGPAALIGMTAWIADDVVGRGDTVDAEWFKAIVTGEERSVPRKGLANIETRFGIPVLWTANHLPRVKDDSQAVYNRAILVPMTKVFSVDDVAAVDFAGFEGMGEAIVGLEISGVLNWALIGLRRILARRHFVIPDVLTEARKEFEQENNPLIPWLAECVEAAPYEVYVDRRDIVASYEGWFVEAFGKQQRPMTPRSLHPAIQRQMPETVLFQSNSQRFTRGLRLTDEGIAMRNLCVKNSMDDRGSGREDREVNIGEKPFKPARFGEEE